VIAAKTVMGSLLEHAADVGPLAVLSRFRIDFHACLTARADELSELADAVLCTDGPVRDLAGLSLAPEHRPGHGALYDAVSHGRVGTGRLRRSLAGLALPRAADGRLVVAAGVSNWLRPGAAASPDPQITTSTETSRYGTAVAAAWDRVHPRLTHRTAWLDHDGDLPVIEGTLIRLQAGHLPGDRDPSRYGCGGRAPAPRRPMWTGAGRPANPTFP
jgi:DDE superfamily endonuclease